MTDLLKIKKETCKYFNLDVEIFDSRKKTNEVAKIRQFAMVAAKMNTKHSLQTIGGVMGNRDHCTVLHAIKTVNNCCETDRYYKEEFEEFNKCIKGVLKGRDIVTIKAVLTIKDSQFNGLAYYYTFRGQTFLAKEKQHTIECSTLDDVINGFNINEVEKMDIQVINNPVVQEVYSFTPENEMAEVSI